LDRKSSRNLLNQDSSGKTAAANLARTSSSDTNIVANNEQLARDASSPSLLNGHAKVQNIPRVVHDDNKNSAFPSLLSKTHEAAIDLLCRRRCKYATGYGTRKQTLANEAGEGRLMARASA
jgi:hypothetical protein